MESSMMAELQVELWLTCIAAILLARNRTTARHRALRSVRPLQRFLTPIIQTAHRAISWLGIHRRSDDSERKTLPLNVLCIERFFYARTLFLF